ncbi:histone deacetylase family protein [Alteriqipengyuania lutimaris]|uniref:Histone deacetylase family protein n=1 Tax=Alteriqipengyuania lutimaris TaxID=1538146 RepID=A0A395LP72_9SPHN|nr:histone deacetylase family protein [Alteriqipengyuania lutimaris]
MKAVFDDRQLAHAPVRELHNGDWVAYAEVPGRAGDIAALLDCRPPGDHGLAPILAVHDAQYVSFLKCAFAEWHAAGRQGDAIGYTFPVVQRRDLALDRIDAQLGRYSYDAGTPIAQGTWQAAYWSAQTALSALHDMTDSGERTAFALCRPPGHHAGPDYMGGYCYLNNAAIAARQASALGLGPVAVLDVDYHHGNGTQDIFWQDDAIFFASIHADPRTDYPFYWGYADERGEGAGEGTTLNLPLPRGTGWGDYREALMRSSEAIANWGAKFLVLSFGADTYEGDPISGFSLSQNDFPRLGEAIGAMGLSTLVVMEGGYAVDDLGRNVTAFLDALPAQ